MSAPSPSSSPNVAPAGPRSPGLSVETHGLDAIAEGERHGRPRDLFWPWFAANVSVLAMSYGAWLLGFGISLAQASVVAVVGIIVSFLLVGVISIAGKRGSAPTMVLTRAAFGVGGSRVASVLSWLLTVGWETILVATATLATWTVVGRLGWSGGTAGEVATLLVIAALVVIVGVYGYEMIMRVQQAITIVTGIITIVYVALAAPQVDLATVGQIPAGPVPALLGALFFVMTGFGLGWVNAAADYSRYLPRRASGGSIVWWTTFGGSVAPVLLVIFGLLLAGSDARLADAVSSDPIGALAQILPTWFLIPFALVAILGLLAGAIMDIYSSGLALLGAGLRIPRPAAAGIDGVIMTLGALYIVFVAPDFFTPFQGFLITLGVPIAAWTGIFLGDVLLRRRDYHEADLYDPRGRYGDWRPLPLALLAVGSALGWGLVTNANAPWLAWQGYLLGPLGGAQGSWAGANLGVLAALAIGFLGTVAFSRGAVRRQEER